MLSTYVYKPVKYFSLTFFFTWQSWVLAAFESRIDGLQYLLFPLILLGMGGPTISGLLMFARNKDLLNDFLQRFRFVKLRPIFILITLIFMPLLISLAIAISTIFGGSTNQFSFASLGSDQALKGFNFLGILITVLISCSLEEIGWRGYGIDSLNSKFNLFKTSLIFATLWGLWHVPAFFIKNGYFQTEILNLGAIYVVNYFIMLFPITILINWLYAKNNRSILIAILAHASMNVSFALFQIQPFTRIILMFLLIIVASLVIILDRKSFFNNRLNID